MKSLLKACATLIGVAAVLRAAEVPRLPEYVDAVRRDPTQVAAAQRLASALFHRDWMCPASPPLVRWLDESPRVTNGLAVPSPDGKRRLEVQGRRLRLVTLPDVSLMAETEVGEAPATVAWHPSGCVVAMASDRGVEIRDGRGLKLDPVRLRDAVGPALGFSGDGVWLVTGMRGGGVGLWDWAASRCVSVGVPGWARVTSARFATTGMWVSVGSLGGTVTLDARPGGAFDGWFGATSAVQTAVFSPTGARVVSVDVEGLLQSADAAGAGPVQRVRLAMPPRQVSLSPDDGWMGVALGSSKVRRWGWSDGRPMGAWQSQAGAMWTAVDRGGRGFWSAGTTGVAAEWMTAGIEGRHLSVSNEPVHGVVSDRMARWVAATQGGPTAHVPAEAARLGRQRLSGHTGTGRTCRTSTHWSSARLPSRYTNSWTCLTGASWSNMGRWSPWCQKRKSARLLHCSRWATCDRQYPPIQRAWVAASLRQASSARYSSLRPTSGSTCSCWSIAAKSTS